jgi:heptosyltransferase-2
MSIMPPLFFWVQLPTRLAIFARTHFSRHPALRQPSELSVTRVPLRTVEKKEPLSFILFRLDAMGDVVLTTPLLRELKRAYPESRCTVVVQNSYKAILVTNPNVDEILTLPDVRPAWLPEGLKRLLSAIWFYCKRLRRRHFDFAISPRWDTDEHLATFLCVLSDAANRVGYSETATPAKSQINHGFDAAFDICLPPGPVRHEVLRNLEIGKVLGARISDENLEIRLTETDRNNAAGLLTNIPRSRRLVALGIGAQSPGRRWPLERYAAVITRLSKCERIHPVILCSAAERREAERLAAMFPGKSTAASGAPIRDVCAILERCQLFIGNDSGCAHLAAAVNCPTIVISRHPRDGDPNHFNSPVRFGPRCINARVLQPVSGLPGCESACCSIEPHCINAVTVEEVTLAALEMLRSARLPAVFSPTRLLPEYAASRLMQSHSTEAVQRAVDSLRLRPHPPLNPQ